MKQFILLAGAFYGMLSVVLGAFGAHLFKNYLSAEKLLSFETGVRYQMYHALLLLILGFMLPFATSVEKWMGVCIVLGVFLFSFSIYLLSFAEYWKINLKFMGPITPIGGLIMLIGWACLIIYLIKR